MNLPLKTFAICIVTLISSPALAVVQLQVNYSDVSALRGATFEAISVDGEDRYVESSERSDGAFINLDYATPEEARGSAVIITPGNNTPAFQVTIPMDWDGSPLRVDFETQTLLPGEPLDRRSVTRLGPVLGVAYTWEEAVTAAWGTPAGISRGPGDEVRVLPAESDVGTDGFGLSYEHPLSFRFAEDTDMRIGFRYWELDGDESDTAQVPSGDADVFSVFIGIEDTYGTGFFGGPIGIDTRYQLDWESEQYAIGFSWAADCARLGNVQMRPTVEFFWGDYDIEYDASAHFLDAPEVIVNTHQQLDSEYWGLDLGAYFRLPLSQQWSLDWATGLRYQDIESDLMSVQNIDFFGMPSNIRQETEDDESSVGVYASIGTTFSFNEHLSLTGTVRQEWGTAMPGAMNPVSGTPVFEGQTAGVDYEDDGQVSAALRLNLSF